MNTYKGSIRDGVKYLTCNGVALTSISGAPHEWGWYGLYTDLTAYVILFNELGERTATNLFKAFAREYLAIQPEEGFTIGPNQLAYIVEELELKGYRERNRL